MLRHNGGVSEQTTLAPDLREPQTPPSGPWGLAAVVAFAAGIGTSYAAAGALGVPSPVATIAQLIVRLTPGAVVEGAIGLFGKADKPVLVVLVLLISAGLAALIGRLARTRPLAPVIGWTLLGLVGVVAGLSRRTGGFPDLVPVGVGYLTWMVGFALLTAPLLPQESEQGRAALVAQRTRRQFLGRLAGFGVLAVAGVAAGRLLGRGRRRVEQSRKLLRLDGAARATAPAGVSLDVDGVSPWVTPVDEFYRIDTAFSVPALAAEDWSLRIHGLVDREITLRYEDLVARSLTDAWVTICCVSNPVGGDLIGNARWSGVRIADLLAEAGVQDGADAVLQTSVDGWTCGTPLSALTDDRDAMLAVAMNGDPLPIDHGFPVRTIVPGLYGFVSATKWVVDFEVTRFSDFSAYWTQRGWSAQAPVRLMSRVDVPRSGDRVSAGSVRVGGVAWQQHVGVRGVQVSLDGGPWQDAELGRVPDADTWVQWAATVEAEPGDHVVAVRAISETGEVQTAVERDVIPDGATGLHSVDFTAS